MTRTKTLAGLTALSLMLSSTPALAADDTVSESEILDALPSEDMKMMGGGGYGGGIMPPMPGMGITVDATITKEVTPDFVALTGYCESPVQGTRAEVQTALTKLYNDIKTAVGTNGKVRKNGGISIYPWYNPTNGMQSDKMTGTLNIMVRLSTTSVGEKVASTIEDKGCSVSWDVRLQDAYDHELSVLDQLIARLNKRKKIYEKLLRKKLNTIQSAYFSTWADGYSTYDPETNTVEATTTLSVTFEATSVRGK
jgi:hypothetical protein